MKNVKIQDFSVGKDQPLLVVSGPCVIESEQHAFDTAAALKEIFDPLEVNFIYKSSYDKANRSSLNSYRGPGIDKGLMILQKIKQELNLPIFTDVHSAEEALIASEVCDVIQIPAFLCRQTDLLVAAAQTGCVVNVKKGQFMAPWDMKNVIEKIEMSGNTNILLTDRGTTFGYNNLVSDMRGIPIMQEMGYPVLFDATHSVQLPGGNGHYSGGQREFIPPLSRAAIAAGCYGIYAESHPDPDKAKSDSASVISFKNLPELVKQWQIIYRTMQNL